MIKSPHISNRIPLSFLEYHKNMTLIKVFTEQMCLVFQMKKKFYQFPTSIFYRKFYTVRSYIVSRSYSWRLGIKWETHHATLFISILGSFVSSALISVPLLLLLRIRISSWIILTPTFWKSSKHPYKSFNGVQII